MSRPCGRFAFGIDNYDDHPELRSLTYVEKTLADAIVKACARAKIVDGMVPAGMVWTVLSQTGKSHPVVYRYRRNLVASGVLVKQASGDFFSPIAERICKTVYKNALRQGGAEGFLKAFAKESLVAENRLKSTSEAEAANMRLPRPVPDLEKKDLSTKLKADAPPVADASIVPEPVTTAPAADAKAAPDPPAVIAQPTAPKPVAVEVKSQVARQAGLEAKQDNSIADTILSVGMAVSNMSIEDFMNMPEVDLDALDTEAILRHDRQEATLLAPRKAPAKATWAPPPADALTPSSEAPEPLSEPPQTTQRLPKSVIRFNLYQMAEALSDFTYGEKEVNALRKWPVTEAQLVDLKNAAVARKRCGKLTGEAGAYLYGAVRRASLGMMPVRQKQ